MPNTRVGSAGVGLDDEFNFVSTALMTDDTVQIEEAAALYELAPSAGRRWEREGVLPPPLQTGGPSITSVARRGSPEVLLPHLDSNQEPFG